VCQRASLKILDLSGAGCWTEGRQWLVAGGSTSASAFPF
jgi:hypothetical protein